MAKISVRLVAFGTAIGCIGQRNRLILIGAVEQDEQRIGAIFGDAGEGEDAVVDDDLIEVSRLQGGTVVAQLHRGLHVIVNGGSSKW